MSETPRTEAFIDSCGDYEKWVNYRDRLHEFARNLERELIACNAEWNERYQRMLATEKELRAEIRSLRGFKASVDEALNMGDGSYRP